MKARACFAADVVQSDEFLGMTIKAQLLYFLMAFHADVCGRIVGPTRVCRGYGFAPDVLDELYERGYLLDVGGGVTVDAHTWRNNTLDGRLKSRLDAFGPFASGVLGFVGEPFKSAYQLNDVATTEGQRKYDVDTTPNTTTTQRQRQPNTNVNPTETESKVNAKHNVAASSEEDTDLEEWHPCKCPKCGDTDAVYTPTPTGSTVHCPTCGTFPLERPRRR